MLKLGKYVSYIQRGRRTPGNRKPGNDPGFQVPVVRAFKQFPVGQISEDGDDLLRQRMSYSV